MNANGEKFEWDSAMGTSESFIDGKCIYTISFVMTQYDTTDDVTLVLDIYGNPIKIELKTEK